MVDRIPHFELEVGFWPGRFAVGVVRLHWCVRDLNLSAFSLERRLARGNADPDGIAFVVPDSQALCTNPPHGAMACNRFFFLWPDSSCVDKMVF